MSDGLVNVAGEAHPPHLLTHTCSARCGRCRSRHTPAASHVVQILLVTFDLVCVGVTGLFLPHYTSPSPSLHFPLPLIILPPPPHYTSPSPSLHFTLPFNTLPPPLSLQFILPLTTIHFTLHSVYTNTQTSGAHTLCTQPPHLSSTPLTPPDKPPQRHRGVRGRPVTRYHTRIR